MMKAVLWHSASCALLCSSFGVDFRCGGNHARRETSQSTVSRDWAIQRFHECIVGWPCRCGPARNLGLHAIAALALGRRDLARRSRRALPRRTKAAESGGSSLLENLHREMNDCRRYAADQKA